MMQILLIYKENDGLKITKQRKSLFWVSYDAEVITLFSKLPVTS